MVVNRWVQITVGTAAAIVLAGCGTTPQAGGTSTTSSQSSAAGAPTTATSEASTPAASPTATSGSSSPAGGGDDGTKPSKSQTVDGLTKFYENNQHLPSAQAQKFAQCMVDQMYDKASPATITAMKNGNPASIDKADGSLLAQSAIKCQSALR